eukprot:TRINITY_DN2673_c0_g1_i3.p1 TRINITY_DN2673_c0_g1~~TRINITY_DN2673_c0_g1_i3.p1  ORF type:complete len:421 (-),score=53.53 TRINITY_DN2673_c0_g1_i3:166-1332(-)
MIVLNSVSFDCYTTTTTPVPTPVPTPLPYRCTDVCSPQCPERLNNFGEGSSANYMSQTGWVFSWADPKWRFRPSPITSFGGVAVPATSYYGWNKEGDGILSLVLHGSGTATVGFGNAGDTGEVILMADGEVKGTAFPKEISLTRSFWFHEGTLLQIKEAKTAILVLNSVSFDCSSTTTTTTTATTATTTSPAPTPVPTPGGRLCTNPCDVQCSTMLNRFGEDFSADYMMQTGWRFSWVDRTFRFRPSPVTSFGGVPVPATSYYGWNQHGDGILSLVLHESGQATVDFGNAGDAGYVIVVAAGDWKATSRPRQTSVSTSFWFNDGTLLEIKERGSAILVLNRISFDCRSTTTTTTTATTTTTTAGFLSGCVALRASLPPSQLPSRASES